MKNLKYNQNAQRIAGLLMLILCGSSLLSLWQKAIAVCQYKPEVTALFSMFTILGIGLLLFPLDHRAIERQYGTELNSWGQLPRRWKILLVVGFFATIANLLAIENSWRFLKLSCMN